MILQDQVYLSAQGCFSLGASFDSCFSYEVSEALEVSAVSVVSKMTFRPFHRLISSSSAKQNICYFFHVCVRFNTSDNSFNILKRIIRLEIQQQILE